MFILNKHKIMSIFFKVWIIFRNLMQPNETITIQNEPKREKMNKCYCNIILHGRANHSQFSIPSFTVIIKRNVLFNNSKQLEKIIANTSITIFTCNTTIQQCSCKITIHIGLTYSSSLNFDKRRKLAEQLEVEIVCYLRQRMCNL